MGALMLSYCYYCLMLVKSVCVCVLCVEDYQHVCIFFAQVQYSGALVAVKLVVSCCVALCLKTPQEFCLAGVDLVNGKAVREKQFFYMIYTPRHQLY
jgi:hypothetical protein